MAAESQQKNVIAGKVVNIEHTEEVKDKIPYIRGNVFIETGPDNIIPVSFYASSKKKDGKDNPLFASLKTVVSEYKTIAANGREEADMVEVGANNSPPRLAENSFFVRDGQLIRGFQFSSPFFNRRATIEPKGEFNVTGEIVKIIDEIKGDEPTGNLILSLLIVTYGNTANIVDFYVEGEKAVEYVKNNYSPGFEIQISGDIRVVEHLEEKVTEAAFGDPIVETIRKVERKLIVRSATPPVESKISDEERNTMLAERESSLQKKKEEAATKNKQSSGAKTAADFSL